MRSLIPPHIPKPLTTSACGIGARCRRHCGRYKRSEPITIFPTLRGSISRRQQAAVRDARGTRVKPEQVAVRISKLGEREADLYTRLRRDDESGKPFYQGGAAGVHFVEHARRKYPARYSRHPP